MRGSARQPREEAASGSPLPHPPERPDAGLQWCQRPAARRAQKGCALIGVCPHRGVPSRGAVSTPERSARLARVSKAAGRELLAFTGKARGSRGTSHRGTLRTRQTHHGGGGRARDRAGLVTRGPEGPVRTVPWPSSSLRPRQLAAQPLRPAHGRPLSLKPRTSACRSPVLAAESQRPPPSRAGRTESPPSTPRQPRRDPPSPGRAARTTFPRLLRVPGLHFPAAPGASPRTSLPRVPRAGP